MTSIITFFPVKQTVFTFRIPNAVSKSNFELHSKSKSLPTPTSQFGRMQWESL